MLKDVFDRVLGYLPRYLEAVGLVLSRPISEVSTRAAEPAFLKDALVFWLISESLVTATRFIAYNVDAEETPYFLANFIVSAVMLALVSAAFFWSWRLFAPLSFAAVTAAVAYLWGALSPITSVVHILAVGVMRLISPEASEDFSRALMGCATPRTFASLEVSLSQGGGGVLALAGIYALIFAAESILLLVYFVCFLRILARLSGLVGGRLWIAGIVSVGVLTAAAGIGAFFHQALMQGLGHCSEDQTTGRSLEYRANIDAGSRPGRPTT